jgi:hypothetical protein
VHPPDEVKLQHVRHGLAVREVEAEVGERRRAARWHTLWAFLGVSPAGALPMLGLGWDFGFGGVMMAGILITGIEAWRAVQAQADRREAEERLRQLRAEAPNPAS